MNRTYLDTALLLTRVAPLVFADDTFALKGGTAINLFVRDMPRLSVDLDLVFPDHTLPRDKALARINEAIREAAERLEKRGFQTHAPAAAACETKLLVAVGHAPLDFANPDGYAGQFGGVFVQLDAQHVVRAGHKVLLPIQPQVGGLGLGEQFHVLERLESEEQKVAAAAGGIENAEGAQFFKPLYEAVARLAVGGIAFFLIFAAIPCSSCATSSHF